MFRFKNLRSLLSLAFATLTIILTFVLGFIVSNHFAHGIEREIGQSLGQLANQMQNRLDLDMFARQRDIQIAASLDAFHQPSTSSEHRRARLDILQRTYPAYAWIGFVANDGVVRESTGGLLEGESVAQRPWFKQAEHGPVTLDVHQAKLLASLLPNPSGQPLRFVDIATPVIDSFGKTVGILGAHLSWSWASDVEQELLEPLRRFKQIDMFVLDRNGEVLLGPKGYLGKTLDLQSTRASRVTGNGYLIEHWDDGKRYLTGYAESRGYKGYPGLGWIVLARQNLDEAYVPAYSIRRQVWAWGALLGMIFVGMGLMIARRIAKPLLAISDAADRIRVGQVETEIPVSTDYKEVHRLSYSLRSLLVSRLHAEQELKLLNQSLEQRVAERTKELSASEAKTRAIVTQLSEGIVALDAYGAIQSLNPAFCNIFGYAADALVGQNISVVIPELIVHHHGGLICYLDHGESRTVDKQSIDLQGIRKDGSRLDVELTMTTLGQDEESRFVCIMRDVTQRKLAEAHQAAHDVLTGLFNRREFERRLNKTLQNQDNGSVGHALLYLDLDQFKVINDLCGHVAGDELLKYVAGMLKQHLREADILARLGEDEFAVLLQDHSAESAFLVAESLRQGVSDLSFIWGDNAFRISASIGVAPFGKNTLTQSNVLSAADAACYVAKDKGRNRTHVFQPDEEELEQRLNEMSWVSRIHKALQENRFCLYAQKISPVSKGSHQQGHYELLVRMIDEQGKLVPPVAFIPAAERYDLMAAIDRWIIDKAFSFLAHARLSGHTDLNFAINLSGASFNEDNTIDFIRRQFALHRIPNESICFEITETAAIANLAKANAFIRALRADGCKFSLDDFGSGMSSFAYLKNLPVDYLKIDGCFVKDMVDDPIDHAMVTAIHRIGHVMGIQTIAEFVENQAILDKLEEIGVNFAQGYGIAKPCPLETIVSLEGTIPFSAGAPRATAN